MSERIGRGSAFSNRYSEIDVILDQRGETIPTRRFLTLAIGTALVVAITVGAAAQTPTPDSAAWRLMSYADLQRPAAATRTYADIWKDAIVQNNRAYVDRGDRRFADANAPATEAHFVIWSAQKAVVLSVLDTVAGCTLKEAHASLHATIRMCPLRLAIYEGVVVHTLDGGRACMLEVAPVAAGEAPGVATSAAYASYDPAARTVRMGLLSDHHPVDGCSVNIPLPPS